MIDYNISLGGHKWCLTSEERQTTKDIDLVPKGTKIFPTDTFAIGITLVNLVHKVSPG